MAGGSDGMEFIDLILNNIGQPLLFIGVIIGILYISFKFKGKT